MFFHDAGFYKLAGIDDDLVFMENTRTGFFSYLSSLEKTKKDGKKIAVIVMNANPFTRGHEYLIERAAAENDVVHLFVVSEYRSLIPFSVRKQLVLEGSARFSNIIYHDTGSYMISNATFPSYFQKDSVSAIIGHAKLDLLFSVRLQKVSASLPAMSVRKKESRHRDLQRDHAPGTSAKRDLLCRNTAAYL